MSEKIVQLNAEIIKGQIREIGPRQHGGGPHRDVSGGRFRAPGRGHHGRPVGQQGFALTISELNKKAYVHRGFGCRRRHETGQGRLGQLLPVAPRARSGRREARRRRQVPGDAGGCG